MKGWAYNGGDYMIAVRGDRFILAERAKLGSSITQSDCQPRVTETGWRFGPGRAVPPTLVLESTRRAVKVLDAAALPACRAPGS